MPDRSRVRIPGVERDKDEEFWDETIPLVSSLPPPPQRGQDTWRWFALIVMCFATFVSDMSRGIVIPSLLSFVERIGGDEVAFGWAMAVFSVGRIIGSPLIGLWAEKRSIREALFGSTLIIAAGSLMYAFSVNTAMLIVSRIIIGVGGGNLAIPRLYVKRTTSSTFRTRVVSLLTALQFSGGFVSPGLGALVALIPLPVGQAAGLTVTLCAALTAGLALLALRSREPADDKPAVRRAPDTDAVGCCERFGPPALWHWLRADLHHVGIVLFMLLNVLTRALVAMLATAGPLWYLQWAPAPQAERALGVFFLICGCIGVGVFALVALVSTRVADSALLLAGLGGCVVGLFFSYPYRLSAADEYPFWMLCVCDVLVIGLAYPVAHAVVVAAFTKLLPGDSRDGLYLGLLGSAGSVGRVIGPAAALLFLSVLATAVFYRYLRRRVHPLLP